MKITFRNSAVAAVAALVPFLMGCAKKPALPVPDHVVVVIMENRSKAEMLDTTQTPYINRLAKDDHAALFEQSYAVEHPSQPNYFDLFAGSDQGVGDDYVPVHQPYNTDNIARELLDAGKTFVCYSEGLPAAGSNDSAFGRYRRKHNPVPNWMGTGTFQVPPEINQPFTAFPTDFTKLPTVAYVIPNMLDDMHDTIAPIGDAWLRDHIDAYVQWAKTHHSLLILTWDEDDYRGANNILTVFDGEMVNAGTYNDTINHFSVLRTIEDMYKLRHADSAALATPIMSVW